MYKASRALQRLSKNTGCRILSQTLSSNVSQHELPERAQVVICGGGVVGASVAYHLAEAGWKDVVLLEQASLTSGTTWHAAGLLGRSRSTSLDRFTGAYSVDLYKKLEKEGYHTGFRECGSLLLARTEERMTLFKRNEALLKTKGIESHLISASEALELAPLIKHDDLLGGMWIPHDGTCNPSDVTTALIKRAKEKGIRVLENCQVENVLTENNKVSGVHTKLGTVKCDYFVNCAGQWGRQLGELSDPKVRVPLHSCEHFYIVTKPNPEVRVDPMMPVVRDYDGYVYFREWSGGIMAGGFEPVGKPVFHDGIPEGFAFQLLDEDWDHFQVLLEQILHRFPALENAEIRQLLNGPESFTPDGKSIIGEAPEIENYFVAAGMNSTGITSAGGIGYLMADLITKGYPSRDIWSHDIRRFVDIHNNRKFLRDRVKESLGSLYRLNFPHSEYFNMSGRKLRTSPLYPRLISHGAQCGDRLGFERPMYFESNGAGDYEYDTYESLKGENYEEVRPFRGSFHKPHWFHHVEKEYWGCRESVCLIDMSSFTKFELRSSGTEVVDFLQYLCANDVDKPIGTLVHTGMLNHLGGYENDCSVVRLDDNHYFMISPTGQQTRSFHWLNKHLPKDRSVLLSDVTSMYTSINVIGPKAQDLLQELTDTSMQKADFHTMTCKVINLGNASGIKAMRLTHTGEDGFVLYIPSEYALHVYDTLMARGRDYGIRNAGYFALRSLRIEKFFAYWGLDLNAFTTPFEVGREFRVKFDKGDFIGKDALLKQKAEGIKRKFVHFTIEGHDTHNDPWTWGGEPIYRNGKYVGVTTSSCFGYTLNKLVCLGIVENIQENGEREFIKNDFILKNAHFEIDICGKRYHAKPSIYSPTFPAMSSAHAYMPQRKKSV